MEKETAIQKLIASGLTRSEASQEFNDKINYYLRGTMSAKEDYDFAVINAITDILFDEIEEYEEDMTTLLYN